MGQESRFEEASEKMSTNIKNRKSHLMTFVMALSLAFYSINSVQAGEKETIVTLIKIIQVLEKIDAQLSATSYCPIRPVVPVVQVNTPVIPTQSNLNTEKPVVNIPSKESVVQVQDDLSEDPILKRLKKFKEEREEELNLLFAGRAVVKGKNTFIGKRVTSVVDPERPILQNRAYKSLYQFINQASGDRTRLARIRASGKAELKALLDSTPAGQQADISQVTAKLSAEMRKFSSNLIQEEVDKLEKLGHKAPKFAVFSMGSMPRQESGLYTDLEIGIITENDTPEVHQYFAKLSQRMADRIHVLGEEDGFHLDANDNAPLYYKFNFRYMAHQASLEKLRDAKKNGLKEVPMAGSRLLVTTPKKLASYLDGSTSFETAEEARKKFAKDSHRYEAQLSETMKEKHIRDEEIIRYEEFLAKNLADNEYNKKAIQRLSQKVAQHGIHVESVQNATKYYIDLLKARYSGSEVRQLTDPKMFRNIELLHGDSSLFEQYRKERDAVLNRNAKVDDAPGVKNIRGKIAFEKLRSDLDDVSYKEQGFLNGKLDDKVDLKRDLYRHAEQILTNIGFFHGVADQSTLKIADELARRGIMPVELANQSKDLMNFLMELRLKVQAKLSHQGGKAYLTTEAIQSDVNTAVEDLEKSKEKLVKFERVLEKMITPKSVLKVQKAIQLEQETIQELEDKIKGLKNTKPDQLVSLEDQDKLRKSILVLQSLDQFARSWEKKVKERQL